MMTNLKNDQLKRGEFLRSLGMGSAALMAFYCMGTGVTACSSKSDDPTPGTGTTTPTTSTGFTGNSELAKGAINFTVDLTDTNFKTLTTIGNYVYLNDIIVARVNGGSYVALSKICTHENTTAVQYRLTNDDFYCTKHGSKFTDTGSVKEAPATKALTQYKTALSADGNKLTVTV